MVLFLHYLFTCVSKLGPKLAQPQLCMPSGMKQHIFRKQHHNTSYACKRYHRIYVLQAGSRCLKFLKQYDVLRQIGSFIRFPVPIADDWPYDRQSLLWNTRN